MKKYQNFKLLKYWLGTVFLAASLIFISCSEDTNPSIYEDLPKGATPTISTLSPADSGLAGITEITINGNNFSPDISKNIVYFNGEIGTILSASANQLVVKAPKLVNDSVAIKIAVRGVELFSDAYMFSLKSALKQIYDFKDFEFPYAITVDNSNNVYFNFVVSGLSTGLSSINPAGLIETFSPKGGESFYTDLKYAGNGKIYGTRFPPVRAIFGSVAGESPKAVAMAEQTAKLLTLDLDNNKNIWAAGSGGNIYRITPDEADKKAFPFDFSIGSLRFFDGYLYALVNLEATQSIYRFKVVNSDSLAAGEEYYKITENLPDYTVKAITFSEDGKLFMGTSGVGFDPNVLVYLTTDKTLKQWYPEVISGPISNFAWDTGNSLYYIREKSATLQQQIFKINMVIKGAPYFGRD